MLGFGDAKKEQKPPSGPRRHVRSWVYVAFGVVLAAGLGLSLYINRTRSKALQREVAGLRQRMEEIDSKAEAARTRATAAEESARQAAVAKDQAEGKRVTAEAEAKQASDRAEEAKQLAATAEQEKQAALAEAERIRKEREEELGRLQEALQKIAETRRTAMGLVMNLDSNAIQFEFNKAVLLSVNRELLSRIAGILLTSKGYSMTVYGHTDDVGSEAYNQELSEKRAKAVRDYLVEAGIGREIIATKGFGKTKPLVVGTTPAARAKNRRVEVEIVDTILNYNLPK
jgi:outer membrane protein OmpA-like peptidoglycan-associated protein